MMIATKYFADISELLLLTKVDMLHEDLVKEVKNIFRSKHVDQKVKTIAAYMGFPAGQVLPMKSYTTEQNSQYDINILALRNLKHMLKYCDDTLQNYAKGLYLNTGPRKSPTSEILSTFCRMIIFSMC